MPTTLVTGATGFLGSHVARALVERGDDVRVTVRATSRLEPLKGLEAQTVVADVTDRRAVRRALRGVERVFHVAGTTNLRMAADDLFRINVQGTRTVLEECLRAGVERVVHTSSVAAVGPAPAGGAADERQVWRGGELGIPYVDSKHEAEVEVLRIAARGLPVVVVCPTYVLGAGDTHRSSTELVRRFMLRRIPAYVDGAINVVDVSDVAAGHLLADELGVPGERYILGNRNYTWDRRGSPVAGGAGGPGRALHPRHPHLPRGPALPRPRWAVGRGAPRDAPAGPRRARPRRGAGTDAGADADHAGRGPQRRSLVDV